MSAATESATPSGTGDASKAATVDAHRMPSIDEALTAIESMFADGRVSNSQDRICLQVLMKDHDNLKEKIAKLKSLLGRSAKAQREAKVELEQCQKKLTEATKEVDHLTQKVDKLATRPTHMELLADFETNFDRALLQVNQQQQYQSGGESTAAPTEMSSRLRVEDGASGASNNAVDSLLMQELQDCKTRNEKLESLNAALLQRSAQLETEAKDRRRERDEYVNKVTHLELEKRMAVMEADQATSALKEKAASLAEMQMELDMVQKASAKAQRRAHHDEQIIKNVKSDQKYVQDLESQVQALQEWATASAEAKTLALERVYALESQLKDLQKSAGIRPDESNVAIFSSLSDDESDTVLPQSEKILWEGKGSMVIGAGDIGVKVFEYDSTRITGHNVRVVCRWKFDLTADDLTIHFSAFQGKCSEKSQRKAALENGRCLIRDRLVKSGAAGDLERAFFCENSCTLLWSNVKSWVRPRTVRYTVQAVQITDHPVA